VSINKNVAVQDVDRHVAAVSLQTVRHTPGSSDGGSSDDGSQGMNGSKQDNGRRLLPEDVEARSKEIADLIRRNGEELAQNVELVVEKVRGNRCRMGVLHGVRNVLLLSECALSHGCTCSCWGVLAGLKNSAGSTDPSFLLI
jgi:hypothetical protein